MIAEFWHELVELEAQRVDFVVRWWPIFLVITAAAVAALLLVARAVRR